MSDTVTKLIYLHELAKMNVEKGRFSLEEGYSLDIKSLKTNKHIHIHICNYNI